MGNYRENYHDAYNAYMDVIANTRFRSMDEKVNLQVAVGRVLTAAYDFGAAEKEAVLSAEEVF